MRTMRRVAASRPGSKGTDHDDPCTRFARAYIGARGDRSAPRRRHRLGGVHAPRPGLGRPRHRRGQTTGIYCKPSCPARHPKRENVRFFATGAEAARPGFRACLRCKPDEVGRDRAAVAKAVALIAEAEEAPASTRSPPRSAMRRTISTASSSATRRHAGRLCARPARQRAAEARSRRTRVTDAIYDAGYSGPSGFYGDAKERLGMTPSAWRDGGRGETIRWTISTARSARCWSPRPRKGICRLSFDESEAALRRLFPNAEIVEDEAAMADAGRRRAGGDRTPAAAHDLPLDVAGTAFQEAVWRELRRSRRRDPQLCRDRRGDRPAQGGARGRHRQRRQPCRGAHPLPPRDPQRRHARRLCRWLDRKRKLLDAEGHRARCAGTAAGRISACAAPAFGSTARQGGFAMGPGREQPVAAAVAADRRLSAGRDGDRGRRSSLSRLAVGDRARASCFRRWAADATGALIQAVDQHCRLCLPSTSS